MNIVVGRGVNEILFGISRESLISKIGEPDKVSLSELINYAVFIYNDQMTKYKFNQEENYILTSIESKNPQVRLYNKCIIGYKKDALLEFLKSKGVVSFEYEEYEFFETVYCEEISATFEIEFNKVVGIEFSPLYDDIGDYILPEN